MRSSGPPGTLTSFDADDGVGLSGILFEPESPSGDAVVFLHGNGDASVFRSTRTNVLAEGLTRAGIAFFPFDNRGAGLLRWLKRKRDDQTEYLTGGMTHERIRDCRPDIDGALRLVRNRGYRRVHLAGHSTGANKIVLYDSLKPRNTVSSYMLLGPGDDTGLYYRALGEKRFFKALSKSAREIEKGRAESQAPRSWSPFPMTYGALHDTLDPDGDYNIFPFLEEIEGLRLSKKQRFREFRGVKKRMLIAYGSEDEFAYGDPARCLEILRRYSAAPRKLDTVLFEGADHGFHGSQEALADRMAAHVLGSRPDP